MKLIKKLVLACFVTMITFSTVIQVNAESYIDNTEIEYNVDADDENIVFEGNDYKLQDYVNSLIGVAKLMVLM